MQIRCKLILLLVLPLATCSLAQNVANDSLLIPRKTHYKYLGIQTNLLLQQFISFNSNSSINNNPYVFSYSKNSLSTGRGFVFGTGFNLSQKSSNDGIALVEVQDVNLAFRIGSERKYLQFDKFIPFTGVELGFGGVYNKVSSQVNQSVTNNRTVIETTKFFFGPSVRGGLLYSLSKHILLGTEFFFNFQIAYTEVRTNNNFGNSSNFLPANIGFQAPTALFLVFKY